uniref:Putative secreted protein n=1 Tax=Anopheles darlingi TaxID=43151 RepID=A0A2M4DFH9_ANODA
MHSREHARKVEAIVVVVVVLVVGAVAAQETGTARLCLSQKVTYHDYGRPVLCPRRVTWFKIRIVSLEPRN